MRSKIAAFFPLFALSFIFCACNVQVQDANAPGALSGTPDLNGGNGAGSGTPSSTGVDGLRLTGSAVSTSEIDLSWTNSRGSVSRFRLERKSKNGSDPYVVLTTITQLSYQDVGLNAHWEYNYRLSALDAQNQPVGEPVVISLQVILSDPPNTPNDPNDVPSTVDNATNWGKWSVGAGSGQTPTPPTGGSTVTINPGDDLNAKLSASHPGDVIHFNQGVYSISSPLSFPDSRYYTGAGQAEFDLSDTRIAINSHSVITGISFKVIRGDSGIGIADQATGITLSQNRFIGPSGNCIYLGDGLSASAVVNNTFTSCGAGMYGYTTYTTDFSYNDFYNTSGDSMHITWFNQSRHDVKITHNNFHHLDHYALELQGTVQGLDISYNWTGDNIGFHDDYSIATGGKRDRSTNSRDVKIHDNVLMANSFGGVAIEAMGENTAIYNNYFFGHFPNQYVGTANGAIILWGINTSNCSFQNNILVDSKAGQPAWTILEDLGVVPAAANMTGNILLQDGALAAIPQPTIK